MAPEIVAHSEQQLLSELVCEKYSDGGLGVALDRNQQDKYAAPEATLDCESRWPVCRAHCCYILSFALTEQDVTEGVVRWDADWPYRIASLLRARSMGIPDPLTRAKIARHLGNCYFATRQYAQAGRAYEQVLSLLAPSTPAGFGRYAFRKAAAEKGCRAYERAGDEAGATRCRQFYEAATARARQEAPPVES